MTVPKAVEDMLGESRETTVLDHGFTSDQVPIEWFKRELEHASVPGSVRLDQGSGSRLTRGGLFAQARTAIGGDDEQILDLYWSVLCWGSSTSSRLNRRRIAAFANPQDAATYVVSLRDSAADAISGDIERAYDSMRRGHRNKVPYLGPSFFTKWLYFVGGGDPGYRALILDDSVARTLRHTKSMRISPGVEWFPSTYLAYCELAFDWAQQLSTVQRPVSADEVEIALWRI